MSFIPPQLLVNAAIAKATPHLKVNAMGHNPHVPYLPYDEAERLESAPLTHGTQLGHSLWQDSLVDDYRHALTTGGLSKDGSSQYVPQTYVDTYEEHDPTTGDRVEVHIEVPHEPRRRRCLDITVSRGIHTISQTVFAGVWGVEEFYTEMLADLVTSSDAATVAGLSREQRKSFVLDRMIAAVFSVFQAHGAFTDLTRDQLQAVLLGHLDWNLGDGERMPAYETELSTLLRELDRQSLDDGAWSLLNFGNDRVNRFVRSGEIDDKHPPLLTLVTSSSYLSRDRDPPFPGLLSHWARSVFTNSPYVYMGWLPYLDSASRGK